MTLLLGATLVISIYFGYKLLRLYIDGNNDYWPKQGVPYALATEFGSYFEIMTGKKKFEELDLYYYNKHKDAPFIGLMELRTPALMARDMELVKKVMVKDFEHFLNHRHFPVGTDAELSNKFLFNMDGQQWKDTRSVMSPTFSTGKIRNMFDHFTKSGYGLVKFIKSNSNKADNNSINVRNAFGRFTMDIVASTAFGMESKSFDGDSSVFFQMGQRFLNFSLIRTIKTFFVFFAPTLNEYLKLSIVDSTSLNFFMSMARQTMNKRRAENTIDQYSDFLSLMMKSSSDSDENSNNTKKSDAKLTSNVKITDDHIVANSMAFFLAGFDVTESVLSFASFYMATRPELQKKVHEEIQEVIKEFDGKITYDATNKMNYLDMFMSEVTRLHPPATRTERTVNKAYKIPDTNVVLPVGTSVVIPIMGFHRDEQYYPEPLKFDPERFTTENKATRPPFAYMPFGQGPRNCIGMRFSLIATKAAMAHLVHNFEIVPSKNTTIPLQMEDVSGVIKPSKGLEIGFKPRF